MPSLATNGKPNSPIEPATSAVPGQKPVVIGIYGLPASGKTHLLRKLEKELGQTHFAFIEGSENIASLVPGGLEAFKRLEEQEKTRVRERAIDLIREECAKNGKAAVVAGHFSFWSEDEEIPLSVYTENDLHTYTHILYLNTDGKIIEERQKHDTERIRLHVSLDHLRVWQHKERDELRELSRQYGILFSLLDPQRRPLSETSTMLEDFRLHTEEHNDSKARDKLSEAINAAQGPLERLLIIDGDKTLAAEDTGKLFWKRYSELPGTQVEADPLETLFGSPLGYTYTAFRQAVLMYEQATNQEFDEICREVASMVSMHSDFLCLLQLINEQPFIGAVVVTSGLRGVWEKVLEKEGLSMVQVIGGGRLADGIVITAEVKGAFVAHLQDHHKFYVWAFGDSPLDLKMLVRADQATIVVGEEHLRSRSMNKHLDKAITNGLHADQVLLPPSTPERLNERKLPIIKLTDPKIVGHILGNRSIREEPQFIHATEKNAAKLLATPTRNAAIAGPPLREAHRRVGWYLATEFLLDIIGVEDFPMKHVLDREILGQRLFHEQQTLIVALMRGGEPMAYGVNDAFPLAMLRHASKPVDVGEQHLQGMVTVILVDSVINTGKSVVEFINHIRTLHATIRIVIVALVIQADCVSGDTVDFKNLKTRELVRQYIQQPRKLYVVALRVSKTSFVGHKTTDTGNRLFNSTQLD
ncbi:hypothetical protein ACLMJK_005485 [Lecanora helva]